MDAFYQRLRLYFFNIVVIGVLEFRTWLNYAPWEIWADGGLAKSLPGPPLKIYAICTPQFERLCIENRDLAIRYDVDGGFCDREFWVRSIAGSPDRPAGSFRVFTPTKCNHHPVAIPIATGIASSAIPFHAGSSISNASACCTLCGRVGSSTGAAPYPTDWATDFTSKSW